MKQQFQRVMANSQIKDMSSIMTPRELICDKSENNLSFSLKKSSIFQYC